MTVIVREVVADDSGREARFAELYAQAAAARAQTRVVVGQVRASSAQARAHAEQIRAAAKRAEQLRRLWLVPDPGRMQYSAHARLQARLASQPVIEQAKGILMARCGWPADQAFDALRQTSQRENIKLRQLAETIVARTARRAQPQPPAWPQLASTTTRRQSCPCPGSKRVTADRRAGWTGQQPHGIDDDASETAS